MILQLIMLAEKVTSVKRVCNYSCQLWSCFQAYNAKRNREITRKYKL